MQNPVRTLIKMVRSIRQQRHMEAELDLQIEDHGWRNLTRSKQVARDEERDRIFDDLREWRPEDEEDNFC